MSSSLHVASDYLEAGMINSSNISPGLLTEIHHGHGRTAHNMSSSSLRKRSDVSLVSKVQCRLLRVFLANVQEIFFGTKLFVLFPAVPLAIIGQSYGFRRAWIFALSLLGLIPLAERVSFLTEQLAFHTDRTVGGLLNATCGNATELIIAMFALHKGKIHVVKLSLVGSILSNLLLVLGTSLLCGGIVNLQKEQTFDRKHAEVNIGLLLLGAFCHILTMLFKYTVNSGELVVYASPTVDMSRACSIVMLVAYFGYLFFQLKTNRQLFDLDSQEEDFDNDEVVVDDEAVFGFPSAIVWLIGMTIVIAVLSEYVVGTIEDASQSWVISVDFISIILLPIVGNATEHAGAVIFASKNKLDITLGVSLGSATQVSMFVVPLSVVVAWIMGINLDLDFKLFETASLVASILITSITLQDGTSHYLKGVILVLAYIIIGACFFVLRKPLEKVFGVNMNAIPIISNISEGLVR